jgi:hypothetical protein
MKVPVIFRCSWVLFTLIFIEEICNGESEQSPHVKQPKFDLKCKFYHDGMIMELNFIDFFLLGL